MRTRIIFRTCFALLGSDSDIMDLPEGVVTIADLIHWMGREINVSFIDSKTGEIDSDIEIILNGKEVFFYPDSVDTVLNDGDQLEIYLLPLGGG